MSNGPFQLLYNVEVTGAQALQTVAESTRQVDLNARFGEQTLRDFTVTLNRLKDSGMSWTSALGAMATETRKFGQVNSDMARNIILNDERIRKSKDDNIRAFEKQAAAEQRSANATFQLNQRMWAQREREQARAAREAEQVGVRGERSVLSGLRTASVLSGVRDSRSIDSFLGGMGGGAAIAGVGGALALGGGLSLIKNAASQAQDLKRLSDELGITTQQAFKLQAAANVTGQDLGSMGMAARKLADAIEDPGGAGKKTAEELTKAGISIQQSMGGALEDVLNKLSAITDPAERARLAMSVFGREGARIAEVAASLKDVGQSLDENVEQKLVDANKQIKEFSNSLTLIKAQAASALLSAGSFVENTSGIFSPAFDKERMGVLLQQDSSAILAARRPVAPKHPEDDFTRLDAALNNRSKESLEDRLARAKSDYQSEVEKAKNLRVSGGNQSDIDGEAKKVNDLRMAYEKLEAAKKAAARDPNQITDLIANYRGEVTVGQADRDPVAVMQERLRKQLQDATKEGASHSQLSQIRGIGVDDYMHAVREREASTRKMAADKARLDSEIQAQSDKQTAAYAKSLNDPANPLSGMFGKLPELQAPGQLSAKHLSTLGMTISQGQAKLQQAYNPDMNQGIVARQNLEMRLQEIDAARQQAIEEAKVLDTAKQQGEIEKANVEAMKAGYEAQIQYETRIAEIKNRQKEETANFVTGWARAALSHQPNASSNYLREFGQGIFEKMIGNASKALLPTMNSAFTLQRDPNKQGIFGTGKNPNIVGKIFEGTPLGFDPTAGHAGILGKLGGVSNSDLEKYTPLITANDQNTIATKLNTELLRDLTAVMAKLGGLDTTALSGMGSIGSVPAMGTSEKQNGLTDGLSHAISLGMHGADLAKSAQSGNWSGTLGAFQKMIGPGLTSGFAGPLGGKQNLERLPVHVDYEGTPKSTETPQTIANDSLALNHERIAKAVQNGIAPLGDTLSGIGGLAESNARRSESGIAEAIGRSLEGLGKRPAEPIAIHPESIGRLSGILETARRLPGNAHSDQAAQQQNPAWTGMPTVVFGGDGDAKVAPEGGYTGRLAPSPPAATVQPKQESIADSIAKVLSHPLDTRLADSRKVSPPPNPASPERSSTTTIGRSWPTIPLGPPLVPPVSDKGGPRTIELPAALPPSANASPQPVLAMTSPLTTETGNSNDLSGSLDQLGRMLGRYSTPSLPGIGGSVTDSFPAPPTIDTSSEYAPEDVLASLRNSLGKLPTAPAFPSANTDAPGNGMSDVLASISRGDIGRAAQVQQKQQDPELNAATGLAKTLSGFLGGGKYTESGYGLGGVLTGGMDLGNGQGVALNGMQRLGLGLGIGAQAAGGTYEAVQGFGKGGARGDIQGIGGVLAAAAPFAGPAAPFLEAGAAITGLISSLFPDPRQERMKAMQRNLENSAYIMPAARNYDYANGSDGGFSTGSGNSLRAGGPNANYTVNLTASALDSGSVLNHFKQSPELWSQAMLIGMTSGDASAVQSLVSWNSQQGSNIPNVWSNSGGR